MSDMDREWTQGELRAHLIAQGWPDEKIGSGPIPQWVKFGGGAPVPLTEVEIDWAKRVIAEHPEWRER